MRRGALAALLIALVATAAPAQEGGPRPMARPSGGDMATLAEGTVRPVARPTPDAPARPTARPADGAAEDDGAIALPELPAAQLPAPPSEGRMPPLPGPGAPPAPQTLTITLALPPGDAAPSAPPMQGPPQMVMAEMMMAEPPPPPVFLDAWTGVDPVLRPEAAPAPDGAAPFLRPEARPETLPAIGPAVTASLRPRARPAPPQDPAPLVTAPPDSAPVFGLEAADAPQFSPLAVAVALRPPARDPRLVEQVSNRQPPPTPRGALCGLAGLEGEVLAAIRGSGGCGIEEPVRLISVGGVQLSSPATMNCETAAALLSWVQNSALPRFNNRLARIETMGSYDCRPRNNQAGARLSEHGKGRAIDIGGFVLTTGERITVLSDWGSRAWGEALRALHRDACGIFGTVLGPNANRAHANHFHFDTADYRSGAYCR